MRAGIQQGVETMRMLQRLAAGPHGFATLRPGCGAPGAASGPVGTWEVGPMGAPRAVGAAAAGAAGAASSVRGAAAAAAAAAGATGSGRVAAAAAAGAASGAAGGAALPEVQQMLAFALQPFIDELSSRGNDGDFLELKHMLGHTVPHLAGFLSPQLMVCLVAEVAVGLLCPR